MFHIGAHLSVAKGFRRMGEDALAIGADTFQFFTRNPRGVKAKDIQEADAAALRNLLQENKFAPIIAHAPYTLNACAADPRIRELALELVRDDIARMERLPGNFYNLHPGSHVGQGTETGIRYIADLLNAALYQGMKTTVLLETMAGKGSEVGRDFEELQGILEKVTRSEKLGVCIDICHISDAGYDVAENLDGVLEEFERKIGLDRLYAVHINDSLHPMGSHKDRHAKLGEGVLGIETMARIINHPKLQNLPMILETPTDLAGHGEEIAWLKRLYKNEGPGVL